MGGCPFGAERIRTRGPLFPLPLSVRVLKGGWGPYSRPYGEKFRLADVAIAQGFQGKIRWNGNQNVLLEADFGDAFRQVAYWRYNSPVPRGQAVDFWLEYHRDPEVEISMVLTLFAAGSASDVLEQWELGEGELEKVVQVACGKGDGTFFVSLRAKGRGRLWLTALHKRISRGSHGYFLPGGERYVTAGRERSEERRVGKECRL